MRITEKQLRRIIKEELIREVDYSDTGDIRALDAFSNVKKGSGFGDVKMAEYEDEQVERQMKEIEAGNLPDNLARDLGFLIFNKQIKDAERQDNSAIGRISAAVDLPLVLTTYIDIFGLELGTKLHQYGGKKVPSDLKSKMDAALTEHGHKMAHALSRGGAPSFSDVWNIFKMTVRSALESGQPIDFISAI